MSIDEKLDALLEKVSRLAGLAETTANQVIRLDQNVLVLAGRADAIEVEVTGIKPSLDQLQRAVVLVAKDVAEIRDRVIEQDDRLGSRIKKLENGNGVANGHG